MNPQTFIFIGRSGCGKGTQADLLQQKLREKTPETPIFYLETGERFREYIQSETYSSNLSKDVMEKGGLQPEFLAVWNWSSLFVEKMQGNEHLVLDGTPRKLDEAEVLSDRVCVLDKGKIVLVDTPHNLKQLYQKANLEEVFIHLIDQQREGIE